MGEADCSGGGLYEWGVGVKTGWKKLKYFDYIKHVFNIIFTATVSTVVKDVSMLLFKQPHFSLTPLNPFPHFQKSHLYSNFQNVMEFAN